MKGLWVKVSVDFLDDPKIAAVGVLGEALFIRGLAFAKKNGNDSKIPLVSIPRLGFGIPEPVLVAESLCEVGLWADEGDGYRIVAWEDWQHTESTAGRSDGGVLGNHRRWHKGKHVPGCPHCEDGEGVRALSGVAVTAPASVHPEAERLCSDLAAMMVRNGTKPPTITSKWLKDMEAVHRLDGHEWSVIGQVLRWSQTDPFWRTNILSPGKFRTQFDRLKMKALGDTPSVAAVPKKPEWVADSECAVCGGDGFASEEDERGNTVFVPCQCRRKGEA